MSGLVQVLDIGAIPGVTSGLLGAIKGARNGAIYGARVRLAHSIVMSLLFRKDPWRDRLRHIMKMTLEHAATLGAFAFVYKGLLCVMANAFSLKERRPEFSFIAGWVGGFLVWGRSPKSFLSQVNMYIFSRICYGMATTLKSKDVIGNPFGDEASAFRVWAAVCWAFVMFLFEYDRPNQNRSMTGSMVYIYDRSDTWSSILDFLPSWELD